MSKKIQKNIIRINHYPAWKYLIVVAVVIIMFFSALPNVYSFDDAVQIKENGNSNIPILKIQNQLKSDGIDSTKITDTGNTITVVLRNRDEQTKAKSILAKEYGENRVALASVPAAPKWLLDMGFDPIKLGLDLKGGVEFLLRVDMNSVFKEKSERLGNDIEQTLNKEGLNVRTKTESPTSFTLQYQVPEAEVAVQEMMAKNYPEWSVKNLPDNTLNISLMPNAQKSMTEKVVKQNLTIMRDRINQLGITEANVQIQGTSRILIQLPGVQDPSDAKKIIGATASLYFYQVVPNGSENSQVLYNNDKQPVTVSNTPVITGTSIQSASSGYSQNGQPEVNLVLDSEGGDTMSAFTRDHIGQPMATAYVDYGIDAKGNMVKKTRIINVANIAGRFASRFQITGINSPKEAQDLALLLRAGSLSAPVLVDSEKTIGPQLGAENIKNGLSALVLGMVMTLVFMLLWYRKLGWVANLALVVNIICLIGLIGLWPGSILTMPGIAGIVLTVGMAVDTNVIIFERIKDNMREGRTLAQAIDRGFQSAFGTIFDSNFTTLITAVVLYAIGNGPVQGFALVLGLGILTSMFSGIFTSRAIINLKWGKDSRRDIKI